MIAPSSLISYTLYKNAKHRKTLVAIFTDPVNGNMEWGKIEALLVSIGCRVIEGTGSSVILKRMESVRVSTGHTLQMRRSDTG